MRIGIDYRPALVNREGIGRYTRELVRALADPSLSLEAELTLFGSTLAPRRFSDRELGIRDTRAVLHRLRLPSKGVDWCLRLTSRGVDDLVGGADVFHHPQYNYLPVRRSAEVLTLHDCIYMLGADYLDRAAAGRMEARVRERVRRARRVLVPTEYVAGEVAERCGISRETISVTPLGCDHVTRVLSPGGVPPARQPYVLTVSRVDPRKNHLRMLRAFELLVRDGLPHRWVVAGPPGYRSDELARALEDSPARDRVEWRRLVGEDELAALYAGADLFLFASLEEGFGLPPVEAMAAGCAVVTSDVSAMPEVCGDAACRVDPTEPELVFEAARRLLRDRDLHAEMVERGRRRAGELTWRETARKTLAAYELAASVTG